MITCPRCRLLAPSEADRCPACGAAFSSGSVATGVIPIDTTGLPEGATIGPAAEATSTGLPVDATEPGTKLVDAGATVGGGPDTAATILPASAGTVTGGSTFETGESRAVSESPRRGGPLHVGRTFGPRYHIIRLLGVGGMGAVYQAWDAELGVTVALKVIRTRGPRSAADAADLEKRFKNELLLARQVTHKHVVRIHDLGEIDGIKYITMPYVDGHNLASLLEQGKLPVARALSLARQMAEGLKAAHEAGVVHRDLKPANIMIGADDQALIMDFGISASSDEAAAGGIVGTLEYMAPEQGQGKPSDARADIYAFGLMLYEMLAGPRDHPATGPERVTAMRERIARGVPPVRALDPSIPDPLDRIVNRCLERDPEARFQTSADLLAALNGLKDDGTPLPVYRRFSSRQIVAAGALVVMLLGGTWWAARGPAPPVHIDPVVVLVADFDNRSGDPAFQGAVEQTLAIALEGASYITLFKPKEARTIAGALAPDKSTRITEDVGRLIAHREGIKVLVAGSIDAQGSGYRVQLRALDPVTAKPLATASRSVNGKDQVLNAVASMALNVRQALGESKSEMAKVAAAETVTAASLDAMHAYARAQELQVSNQYQAALQQYQRAVELDPQFGRAYAGIAGVYANYFKQPEKAEEAYQKAIKYSDRMTERERYRTLGTYYIDVARNYEKGIENFETLVKLYPADDGGHGNLALAYMLVGNIKGAEAEVQRSLEIYPNNFLQRYNFAMYSMYAGDFAAAVTEAQRVRTENPGFEYAWLPEALSTLAQGDVAGARQAYTALAQMSAFGSSFAALGRADLEMYFGRPRAAIALLREAIDSDVAAKIPPGQLARKYVALADAYVATGELPRAAAAAARAVELARNESTLFPAARALLHAGRGDQALQIALELDNMLQRHTTAYARIISGEDAFLRGRLGQGIELLRDGQKRRDFWFTRFLLGKAYVEAGHFTEGLAELDEAVKRRGETTDAFFDDLPTIRYLPPAYYWLGRAQEGTAMTGPARESYETFLKLRADADVRDPLAVDAERRVSGLR